MAKPSKFNLETAEQLLSQLVGKVVRGYNRTADPEQYGFQSATTATSTSTVTTPHFMVRLIRFCAMFAIGSLIFANIKPYINIIGWLGSGLGDMGIVPLLMQIPPVRWALTTGAAFTTFIAGFLLWGLLQGLQMLPVLMKRNPEALLVLMGWLSKFKGVAYADSDSAALRQLKQQFNAIPVQWLEDAQQARAIAYIVDAVLCFGFYPPIVGGYDRLGVVMFAPSPADIDWRNICASLAAMFGVEVLYHVWRLLNTALELLTETTETAA
jgi:hypothetical protein